MLHLILEQISIFIYILMYDVWTTFSHRWGFLITVLNTCVGTY